MPKNGMPTQVEDAAIEPDTRLFGLIAKGRKETNNEMNLQVNGQSDGNIAGNRVTVLEGATVRGNVDAKEVTVHGAVRGLIQAASIAVGATAFIKGEMRYNTLSVDSGARIEARCVPSKTAA